jgi:hypothetical protein
MPSSICQKIKAILTNNFYHKLFTGVTKCSLSLSLSLSLCIYNIYNDKMKLMIKWKHSMVTLYVLYYVVFKITSLRQKLFVLSFYWWKTEFGLNLFVHGQAAKKLKKRDLESSSPSYSGKKYPVWQGRYSYLINGICNWVKGSEQLVQGYSGCKEQS